MKNGGTEFHKHVLDKNFAADIAQIAETCSEKKCRDKALELIRSWSQAFGSVYGKIERDFNFRGIRFPDTTNSFVPIRTPPKRVTREEIQKSKALAQSIASTIPQDRREDIRTEVEIIVNYIALARDSMSNQSVAREEAVSVLRRALLDMQERLSSWIIDFPNEHLVNLLLQINEDLQETLDHFKGEESVMKVFDKESLLLTLNTLFGKLDDDEQESKIAVECNDEDSSRRNDIDDSDFFAIANREEGSSKPKTKKKKKKKKRSTNIASNTSRGFVEEDILGLGL